MFRQKQAIKSQMVHEECEEGQVHRCACFSKEERCVTFDPLQLRRNSTQTRPLTRGHEKHCSRPPTRCDCGKMETHTVAAQCHETLRALHWRSSDPMRSLLRKVCNMNSQIFTPWWHIAQIKTVSQELEHCSCRRSYRNVGRAKCRRGDG